MATIGYARVSSLDQDFDSQVERLAAAGCSKVYSEKASGKSTNGRHALDKAIRLLQPGDTLVTVRLDRLARSIRDLLTLVDTIQAAGARIKALEDPWLDTTTPHGELILTVMGGMAEFERKLIRARCDEGIKRALARGSVFGRKSVLDAGERRKIAELCCRRDDGRAGARVQSRRGHGLEGFAGGLNRPPIDRPGCLVL